MLRVSAIFLIILSITSKGLGQEATSTEAQRYIDEFFTIVSERILDRENVDWDQLRARADSLAAGAQVPSDTYDALNTVLRSINTHSRLIDPEFAKRWSGQSATKTSDSIVDIPQVTGQRIAPTIAYINVPMVGSGHSPTLNHFATSAQSLIAELDGPEITGWIVDLRENTGGNCWPMLAGVGPVLGEGVCGYFMERDGSGANPWAYEDGASSLGGNPITQVTGKPYRLLNPAAKVAVLTGPKTASSGEVTTVAFRGKENTRSFGQETMGYSTTNTMIAMSDSALLNLTVSIYADRDKVGYGDKIVPDVATDTPLAAAIEWLEDRFTAPGKGR